MKNTVLWADDDSDGSLVSLDWLLRKRGISHLERARDFVTARDFISERRSTGEPVEAVLLDVILPYAHRHATVDSYLGLRLAEHALSNGVKAVAFLSVVRQIEVIDSLRDLQQRAARFVYVDKLKLLEGKTIDELAGILIGPTNTRK